MKLSTFRKIAIVGSLASIGVSAYVLFGDHNWFNDRPPLTMEVAELEQTPTGPEVLERYRELKLRCGVDQTSLGAQACWSDIGSFNGIPAQSVTFYFDKEQHLTAWKLAADSGQHEALRNHFTERYGKGIMGHGAVLSYPVGQGTLMLAAQPGEEGRTTVLWVNRPMRG